VIHHAIPSSLSHAHSRSRRLRWRAFTRTVSCVVAVIALSAIAVPSGIVAQQQGVRIGLNYGGDTKLRLVVDSVRGVAGDSIGAILSRDLDYSDRFVVIPSSSAPVSTGQINYALFQQLQVNGVVEATVLPSGWLRVELHDVLAKAVKNKQDFPLPGTPGQAQWRMALHGVSDAIEEWITGQRGVAQTRVAYSRDGRIWLVDSDGANANPITSRGLTPKWTPNGRALVYNYIDSDVSPIMLVDIGTGAQKALTSMRSTQGQDYAPAVTPDGRSVIFSRNTPTGTDLYSIPLTGGSPVRLTSSRGRDSFSPTISPDGLRMSFAANRAGNVEVYVADADGTNIQALTSGGVGEKTGRDSPDWSPDGRWVAYQSGIGTSQQVMVVNVRDQSMRQVTSEGRNDDPSWAPDSRHVVVTSTRGGSPQLWVIDVQGGRARQLTRGSASRAAAWSPRLTGTP
jgi:TolB protein